MSGYKVVALKPSQTQILGDGRHFLWFYTIVPIDYTMQTKNVSLITPHNSVMRNPFFFDATGE